MQFQRNDKKRSAQPASGGRPAKDLQPTKTHPQRHCPGLLLATPAHAGKSTGRTLKQCAFRDHPRTCGEKPMRLTPPTCITGSPPRMRGKVQIPLPICPATGITPACAGKSLMRSNATGTLEDHPRVCGEKQTDRRAIPTTAGSPPRVRGKAPTGSRPDGGKGITPACAGKSPFTKNFYCTVRDHPRVCGEKCQVQFNHGFLLGSPPRVRGKGPVDRRTDEKPGITPACVGKS